MGYWPTTEELTMYRLRGYDITITNGTGADGTDSLFECKLDGSLHRDDGPAYMRLVGESWYSVWYQHGKRHRDDGPAVGYLDGTALWFQLDQKHRDAGPAVNNPNGKMAWYQNNRIHREDGPAIIHPSGYMVWCQNDRFHREDGPAVIHPDGSLEWWLDSIEYQSREDWEHELERKLENGRAK